MKKKLFIVGLMFSLLLLLVACGSKSSNSDETGGEEKVKISYLTHWAAPQVEELNAKISEYNEIEPNVEIEVRAVPFGNLLTTLTTQGSSPQGPTITNIYDMWLPQLIDSGITAFAPEDNKKDIQGNYPEGIVNAITIEDEVYGYPNEVNLYALNYNESLFEEAGLSEPPKDWEQLIEYANKLTKKDDSGNITQQGFGIINSWDSGTVHPWLSLLYSNGGEILDDNHLPLLDSNEAMEVTKLYSQLIFEDETTDPTMATANASTTGPYLDNFANEKTAMIIMANWWKSALEDSMGEGFEKIKTAPIPVGPGGETSHSVSYSWLTTVSANADEAQQEAAWAFLKWLNSDESGEDGSSGMGDILMGMGIMPSRSGDLEAHQNTLGTPFLETYVAELENAKGFPIVLGGNELTAMLQNSLEAMEFENKSSDEAMDTAQQVITELLEQHYAE